MIKIATFILFLLGIRMCVEYWNTAKYCVTNFFKLRNRGFHAQDIIHADEMNFNDGVIHNNQPRLSKEEILIDKKQIYQTELKNIRLHAEMAIIEFLYHTLITIISFLLSISFQFNINL